MQVLPLAFLAIYIFALIVATRLSTRKESAAQFMIGAREVGTFATMASIVGNLRDGAGLAAWVLLSNYFGFGSLWLTAGLAVGLLVLGVWAPALRELASKHDYITLNQLFGESIGPATARLSSAIIAVTALLYAAAQVYVAGRLFSAILGIAPLFGILLTALVVGGYLVAGGYKTTILTGIVQWVIIMVVLILPWTILSGHNIQPNPGTLLSISPLTALGFFGISFLVVLSSADIWQLIFSASSPKTARNSLVLSIPIYFVISIGMVLFGLATKAALGPGVDLNDAFFQLFSSASVGGVGRALVGVFAAAAVMSTLDSQVFLFTSTLVSVATKGRIQSSDPEVERRTRLWVIVTMIVLAGIAATIGNLIEFLFGAVTLATVLVPVIFLAILGKPSTNNSRDKIITAVLVFGSIIYAIMFASGKFANITLTLVPALATSAVMAIALMLGTRTERRSTL